MNMQKNGINKDANMVFSCIVLNNLIEANSNQKKYVAFLNKLTHLTNGLFLFAKVMNNILNFY